MFAQTWKPLNGSRDTKDHYTALTNATIYVDSGQVIQNGTLLIKNERIIAVGNNITIPKNSLVLNLKDKYIYPSFIELYSHYGIKKSIAKSTSNARPQIESKKAGQFYWNESIHPETNAIELFRADNKAAEKYRKMGFGVVLTHQQDGIIRGTSALVSLGDRKDEEQLPLLSKAAMQYAFHKGSSQQTYPNSLMGMIALIRQVHHDAIYYSNKSDKLALNQSLEALIQLSKLPKIIDVGNTLSLLRAHKIAREFDFQFIMKGNGTEYGRAEEIKTTGAPLIVPVNFPKVYDVSDPFDARRLSLKSMKTWELAPFNLRILSEHNIPHAITSEGTESAKDFLANLKKGVESGAKTRSVIHSLTMVPAELMGLSDQIGSLHTDKLANFIITNDSLFSKECNILSNWIQGKEYIIGPEQKINLVGNYSLNIDKRLQFEIKVEQKNSKWIAKVKPKGKEKFIPSTLKINRQRIAVAFNIEDDSYQLSGSVSDSLSRIWSGKTLLNGKWVDWAAIKMSSSTMGEVPERAKIPPKPSPNIPAIYFPNMAYGRDSISEKAKAILFRNATIWTNEKEGILKNQDLLIANGKVKMLGYKINIDIMFPELKDQLVEFDLKGKHLTSGIIDEHSHIAIERGVNESGQAITSEVRIGDVINSNDINIYRQLAGGVTTSQLLHGSANPIGGQSAIIKLRWGKSPEEMKVDSADGFIKFALGENVKQSNWGDRQTVRFPQTRMGVEQVFYDAFLRAEEYKQEWTLYNAKSKKEKKEALAPRKDLELEALAEILDSNRFITCHSYIQSEINMLMHVADSMGFQINTFTHILEGYKVANRLREHGASASTFSDWWAYKFEVNDAIPYNGAILHRQGVNTGFNSDDAEMGRRLNQEAAKAVKYGGVSEAEAWKFVTLNPAKMLHLDHRTGSIKVGKDADLVVWSDNPLSVYSQAEQTYIDGILYYDKKRNAELQKRILRERERIIALMLRKKKDGDAVQKIKNEDKKHYECDTLEP